MPTHSMDVPPNLPIIVGITGKRDLAGKDDAVRLALKKCFALLDQALPSSRKILLSAFAVGADTIAVEEAIDRDAWRVIGILPFDPETYAQDFAAAEAAKLRKLLADPRIKWGALTPLIDPSTNRPFAPASLERKRDQSNPDRTNHYEQAGFYIAERCALLIGVMDASEHSNLVGGTARILKFRSFGVTDEAARRIVEGSLELRMRSEIEPIKTNPIWLIDLAAVDKATDDPLRAVEIRNVHFRDQEEATRLSILIETLAHWVSPIVEKLHGQQRPDLVEPLMLARRLDAFNRFAAREGLHHPLIADAGEDASSVLRRVRRAIADFQDRFKNQLKNTIWFLAALFVFAVVALELHIEFLKEPSIDLKESSIVFKESWIVLYVASFVAILVVYLVARFLQVQEYSEDYRAVAEALRVQIAWWDAGMVGRVYLADEYFLVGTVGSLALVRATVKQVIDAALLEQSPPKPSISTVVDWIQGKSGQVNYFRSRIEERKRYMGWVNGVVWILFVLSIGVACGLPSFYLLAPLIGAALGVVGLLVCVPSSLRWRVHELVFLISKRWQDLRAYGLARYGILFFSGSFIFALSFFISRELKLHQLVATKWIALLAVISAAFAGAVRYVADSHAWEAELHRYRDALEVFKRAADNAGLTKARVPLTREQQKLLFDLGRFALEENEFWIRAHRVRPLEPMQ